MTKILSYDCLIGMLKYPIMAVKFEFLSVTKPCKNHAILNKLLQIG